MRGGGGEARGMGEGREGTYVLGWGWSPAGVGAAASRQRKTTAADDVQARRTEGAEQGGAAYGWGRGVGDLASEGGREATVREQVCRF